MLASTDRSSIWLSAGIGPVWQFGLGQQDGAGSRAQAVSLRIVPWRFLAHSKQILWRFTRGVRGHVPPSTWRCDGRTQIERSGVGVEQQAQSVVSAFMDQTDKLLFFRVCPVGQSAERAKPINVSAGVELLLTQHRMRSTKGDHAASEARNLPVLFQTVPVIPARFIVLAIGVVVASLRAAKFVAAEQHRNSPRNEQSQQEVLDLAFSQSLDPSVRRRAFEAVVLTEVGVGPVTIVFSILLIVLVAIAHQIVQSEAVMAGNEIDAALGAFAGFGIYIGTATDAAGK